MASLQVALVFGGRSGEHEVSVLSAASCFRACIATGYDVLGIGITRDGSWVFIEDLRDFFEKGWKTVTSEMGKPCHILPDPTRKGIWVEESAGQIERRDVDVVFPVLHGLYGEDGTIQGLLEMSEIPYVGAPPLGSAICMDKSVTKDLLLYHGIPCVPGISVSRYRFEKSREKLLEELSPKVKYPVFVKPSGSGSSLGVSKVKSFSQLEAALRRAFLYDTKALIEPSQEGCLEVECSVLGNDEPIVSIPGAIRPRREFYDYEAKYLDSSTELLIPAPLDKELTDKVRDIALRAYLATRCIGMARVDFFVNTQKGEAYVSELNTIPGFTQISMYPKLFEASGIPYPRLIRTLVELAVDFRKTSFREVRLVSENV